MKRLLLVACILAVSSATTYAQTNGKPYLRLVGELAAATITPSVLLEFCSERQPTRAAEYHGLYATWQQKHERVFSAIDKHLQHADVILKRQGAPGGDSPSRTLLQSLRMPLTQFYAALPPDQAQLLCDRFPEYLNEKDREFSTTIPDLLAEVSRASAALDH